MLRHRLGQEVGGWEWVWVVEHNPRGTGMHVHAWQRGSFVRQQTLSRLAAREGMGRVTDIRRWHQGDRDGTAYGLKAVVYGFKGTADDGLVAGFMEANGRRLTHQSRGFWTADGARDQEQQAVRALMGDPDPLWQVVTGDHVARTAAVLAARHRTGPDRH